MKSNELMECIHSGEIKENSKIKVMAKDGVLIAIIKYKNGRLEWKTGEFDTSYLCSIFTEFEVIKNEIDIQEIEELWGNVVGDSTQCRDSFMINNRNKINELIKVVKQIDNKLSKFNKVYDAANYDP